MCTALKKIGGFLGLAGLIMFALTACQQKCQQAVDQPTTTLSETQWRLVSTNDPQIPDCSKQQAENCLDRFNFLIMNFRRNFSGDVQRVVFNDLFETPVLSFNWNPVQDNFMLVRYQTVVSQDFDNFDGGSSAQDLGVFRYDYNFNSNSLTLRDRDKGLFYEYVPFTGVVDPDSRCTF